MNITFIELAAFEDSKDGSVGRWVCHLQILWISFRFTFRWSRSSVLLLSLLIFVARVVMFGFLGEGTQVVHETGNGLGVGEDVT